jgi:hypothetical protein
VIRDKTYNLALTESVVPQSQMETRSSSFSMGSSFEGEIPLHESPCTQKVQRIKAKAGISTNTKTAPLDPIWIDSEDDDLKAPLTLLLNNRKRKPMLEPPIRTYPRKFDLGSAIRSLDDNSRVIPTRRRYSPSGISSQTITKDFGKIESLDLTLVEQPVFQRSSKTQSNSITDFNIIPDVVDLTSPTRNNCSPEDISLPNEESPQSLCSRPKVTYTNNFHSASPVTLNNSSPFSAHISSGGGRQYSSALASSSPLQDTVNSPVSVEPCTPMTERSLWSSPSKKGTLKTRKPFQVTSVAWEHELQTLLAIRDGKLEVLHLLKEELKAVRSALDRQQAAGAI